MKKLVILAGIILVFRLGVTPAYAGTFSDNFYDGNTDGWWLGYSLANPVNNGNWRVESGELVQDTGFDGVIALLDGAIFSDQFVETDVKLNGPSGGGGVILWFNDNNNWTHVIIYPAAGYVEASAHVNGLSDDFRYPFTSLANDTWYDLRVVANSTTGDLDIYLDGNYLFTRTAPTPNRSGQSGVINGNAGGFFDNFSLTFPAPLTDKDQCKKDGWKSFTNPLFKNQGRCVSFVEQNK